MVNGVHPTLPCPALPYPTLLATVDYRSERHRGYSLPYPTLHTSPPNSVGLMAEAYKATGSAKVVAAQGFIKDLIEGSAVG